MSDPIVVPPATSAIAATEGPAEMAARSPGPLAPRLVQRLEQMQVDPRRTGIVIVDHGSRRAASNELLQEVVALFRQESAQPIVEPAHMELAEPTIAQAYRRCVEQGADMVIVYPYFLLPGRHWQEDIPRLAAEAAAPFPHTRFLVPAPLGVHPGLIHAIEDRISQCLQHATGSASSCSLCTADQGCRWLP